MIYSIKKPKIVSIYIKNNKIYFKGKLGVESLIYSPFRIFLFENNLEIHNISKETLNYCQTFIGLIQQLMRGVISGYKKQLKFVGIGFKCKKVNDQLELKLGFSHLIYQKIPSSILVNCPKPNIIVIKGTNKQKISEFASFLQNFKFPEPYKGKGIFLKDQTILRKQGKKA